MIVLFSTFHPSYFEVIDNLIYSKRQPLPTVFRPFHSYSTLQQHAYNYLVSISGRLDEAEKLLTFLRGSELLAREELKEYSSITVTVNKKYLLRDVVFLKTIGKVIFLAIR